MNTLEKKEYYEVNLPPYLQHDLDAMKEGHAWYLRERYLDMERV